MGSRLSCVGEIRSFVRGVTRSDPWKRAPGTHRHPAVLSHAVYCQHVLLSAGGEEGGVYSELR